MEHRHGGPKSQWNTEPSCGHGGTKIRWTTDTVRHRHGGLQRRRNIDTLVVMVKHGHGIPWTRWTTDTMEHRTLLPVVAHRHGGVKTRCGNPSGNELTRNLLENIPPQSSQLAEPLCTDPDVKSGISVRRPRMLTFSPNPRKRRKSHHQQQQHGHGGRQRGCQHCTLCTTEREVKDCTTGSGACTVHCRMALQAFAYKT